MSRERDVILAKYNQLIDKLDATDPVQHPQEFGAVLDMLDRMHFFMGRLSVEKHNVVHEIGEAIPLHIGTPVEPVVVEPTEEPEPTEELEEPAKTYSKEAVRAALARARKSGINVVELLGEYGVDNFSALPAGKYTDLMLRLGEDE